MARKLGTVAMGTIVFVIGLQAYAGSASAIKLGDECVLDPECIAGCTSALQLVTSDDPIGPVQAISLGGHADNLGIFIDVDEDGVAPFEYSMTGSTASAECVGGPGGAIPNACDVADMVDELLNLANGAATGSIPPDEFVTRATEMMGPCLTP